MKGFFIIDEHYSLVPYDADTQKYVGNRKVGDILSSDIKQARSYDFHKKMMALFNVVNDNLPPQQPIEYRGQMVTPENTFDSTRKYLLIMAGYCDLVVYPNGKVRPEAQSLSYENMDAETFEKCYSAVIDAALKLMSKKWTGQELERVTLEILRFT